MISLHAQQWCIPAPLLVSKPPAPRLRQSDAVYFPGGALLLRRRPLRVISLPHLGYTKVIPAVYLSYISLIPRRSSCNLSLASLFFPSQLCELALGSPLAPSLPFLQFACLQSVSIVARVMHSVLTVFPLHSRAFCFPASG